MGNGVMLACYVRPVLAEHHVRKLNRPGDFTAFCLAFMGNS